MQRVGGRARRRDHRLGGRAEAPTSSRAGSSAARGATSARSRPSPGSTSSSTTRPGAVLLSGFDGVRREVARLTLEKLLQDGRIHPARIEEAFDQARSEIDRRIAEVGEQAAFEANVGTLHPELIKLLGRLHFRTSYGQNVLAHSIECARLAALLAAELGASAKTAARAAPAARHRQGRVARGRGPARPGRRRARPPLQGGGGGGPRHGVAPQRGRAADDRGRDRADRRLALGRPARAPAARRSSST